MDRDQVTSQPIDTLVASLIDIYSIFMNVFTPLDKVLKDTRFMNTFTQMFERFKDPAFFNTIVGNVVNKSSEMAILIVTVPGADCYTIGYRVASFERFLMGIVY